MGRRIGRIGGLAALLGVFSAAAGEDPPLPGPDPAVFDRLLGAYVSGDGVRYAAWKASEKDREALDAYLGELSRARPSSLGPSEAIAYWINLYNALTLDLVLEHYPVGSIRDTHDAPWDQELVEVEGRPLSLDAIEHEILRGEFDEPRIHFAVNCAAASCPPLRDEAYRGDRLDAQLEEATASFLADSRHNRWEPPSTLHLSRLLDWYREDFEKSGTLVDWVRPYVPGLGDVPAERIEVVYEEYDWALNEAPGGEASE